MKKIFDGLKSFLEKIDRFRDEALFVFIKPYWPHKIIPNHITIVRIIIGIFLFISLFYYDNNNGWLIIPLFFVGIITDLLDGSVARALHKETKLGAMLDSAADRILIIPIAVYSLFSSNKLLFFVIIVIEVINMIISLVASAKNIFTQSNIFGKIKMVLQSVVFLGILIFWPQTPNILFIYILWASVIFLIASIYLKIKEIYGKNL